MTEIKEWLGENNTLGIDIFNRKYRFNNETLDEFFNRVSGGDERVKKLIKEKKFLFGGRTLSNRGTSKKASYSNCYSSGYVPDSLFGIMELNTNLALTYKAQGGQGLSLSKIRPKGTKINGQFESDGIIPFMRIFNETTAGVSQGGSRKGALMMSLSCNHKEIKDFIHIKTDTGLITKANLSVEIDDNFMNAVKKYYDTGEIVELHFKEKYEENVIEYNLKPIEIYKEIMQLAYDWAEPGVILTERFRNYNLMEYIDNYEIVTGNPCFTGDMKLLTENGYMSFAQLEGKEINIINSSGNISKGTVWSSGSKDIIELTLSNKHKVKCTPNHVFKLNNDEECEAKNTLNKRLTSYYGKTNESEDIFVKLGFIQGDGALGRINSEKHLGLEVNIGYKDKEIFELFDVLPVEGKHDYYLNGYNNILIQYGFDGSPLPERVFPITYTSWTKEHKANFLKGCYSANGSIIKTHRIAYKTTSKVFALQLQKTLVEFGITANLTVNKPTKVKFNNGEYLCKQSYDVNINKLQDIINFYQNIGFIQRYKIKNLIDLIKIKSPKVISIKELPEEKVYDYNEPITNWGIVEGLVVHNCGEQPLPKNGACNLGSINLSEYIVNPYTDKASFDIDSFRKDVAICIEALDDVLEEGKSLHALKEQQEMATNYRNIGLGIMGLGDMFFKLGIKYGSKRSKELLDYIMSHMFRSAVFTSNNLAYKKGAFPKYSDKVFESTIVKDHFDKEEIEELKQHGLRNCSLLSVAPSGSIGTMLNITTGIEPAFEIKFKRKTESLHKDKEVYYDVFIGSAEEYMKINKTDKLPEHFISSNEIKWKDRVNIQAIAQYHVDTAISSTVNLSKETTVEEIEQLYLYAWQQGLKGVTIYRSGCKREGVLTDNKPQDKVEGNEVTLEWGTTINSSDDLMGRKRKIMTGCGSLHVEAFFDPIDGKLMEIYLSKGSTGGCNSFMVALSRVISAGLRTGLGFNYAIDQLQSVPECASYSVRTATKKDTSKGKCCPNAISYALIDMQKDIWDELGIENKEEIKKSQPKKIENKVLISQDNLCPECGEKLQFIGGCNSCPSCSWSRCN